MQVLVTDSYLKEIANTIRAKNGSSARYTPGEMAAAILALKNAEASGDSGGGTAGNSGGDTGVSSGGGASGGGGAVSPPSLPPVPPSGGAGDAPAGKSRVGGFTLAAKEDGALSGYVAGKVMMALPNHQLAAFRATIFCPAGVELDVMEVSDFTNGRGWNSTNTFCTEAVRTETADGSRYVVAW